MRLSVGSQRSYVIILSSTVQWSLHINQNRCITYIIIRPVSKVKVVNANRISLSYWQDYAGDFEASPSMIPVVAKKVVRLDTISNLYSGYQSTLVSCWSSSSSRGFKAAFFLSSSWN
jgi:hypothetical protein